MRCYVAHRAYRYGRCATVSALRSYDWRMMMQPSMACCKNLQSEQANPIGKAVPACRARRFSRLSIASLPV